MVKLGYIFGWNVGQIVSQPGLLDEWLSPFRSEMEAAKSFVERLCRQWCIENFIPFKQRVEDLSNVCLVCYDTLVAGLEQWEPIMSSLGREPCEASILERATVKPSGVSRTVVPGPGAKPKKESLSTEDMDCIARTVRLYGLDRLVG